MGVGGQPHAPVASTPRKDPAPIVQEAGWAPGPVWTGVKSPLNRDSIPDRPARSRSLYRLSYPPASLTFKVMHGARLTLSVLYGSQNKQRLVPLTA